MPRPACLAATLALVGGCTPAAAPPPRAATPTSEAGCTMTVVHPNHDAWLAAAKQPLGDVIRCEFRGAAYTSFDDAPGGKARPMFELREGEATELTFLGLGTAEPRVRDARSETPLRLIKDTSTEWILLQQTELGVPVTFLISKLTRSAVWTKTYTNLEGRPFGFMTVGECR